MTIFSIYIVTNLVNAKQYVGITNNLKRRWKEHKSLNKSSPALHDAIKKYGIENFAFSHIADAFEFGSACIIEKLLIKEHNTKAPFGYNLTDGGEGSFGVKPSLETIKKMKDSAKGQKRSKESNEKRKIALMGNKNSLGKKHTEEFKEQRKLTWLNKKHTEESKKKMSEKAKKRTHSEETKEKMRIANKAAWAIRKAKQSAMQEFAQ